MIWFTSDLHFSHTNIAGKGVSRWKTGYRTFNNVKEMNDVLINSINEVVKYDDTLYFLGDFAFGDHRKIPEYRNRIVCKNIHFVIGNHDQKIHLYKEHFTSVNDIIRFKIDDVEFFNSHYAHRVWPNSHRGCIHLYAHSHDSIPDYGKSMDIGVDVAYRLFGKYRPFNIDEILSIMNKKEIGVLDHHAINNN